MTETPRNDTPLRKTHPPSAWMTGWKNGWDQPTNTAARIGHDFGHNVLPALIVFALVVLFVARMARRRS